MLNRLLIHITHHTTTTTLTTTATSATSVTSTSATSSSTATATAQSKYVFAHHMVGNTYPYTQDTWASDIALAQANGIDGFALNVAPELSHFSGIVPCGIAQFPVTSLAAIGVAEAEGQLEDRLDLALQRNFPAFLDALGGVSRWA